MANIGNTMILLLFAISGAMADCIVNPDSDFPEWPPILTNEVGDIVLPTGEENNRQVAVAQDQTVVLSCPGGEFEHESYWGSGPVFATCDGGAFTVSSEGGETDIGVSYPDLGCRAQPVDSALPMDQSSGCGPDGIGTEIQIGFDTDPLVAGIETTTLTVCHDLVGSRTFYSHHALFDEINARDHGNDSPPFNPDNFFDYDVQHFYTMDQQRITIADLVGSQELADQYVQDFNSGLFLARGHLAPNADFIFYSLMDSTYHFINVAPQWQSFNGKNWMYFETGLRDFAVERSLDLSLYTGTHGVCQLEDVNGVMVDIHLYNGNMLPVPRFYWKIIIDPAAGSGVAIVGVNNPHLKSIPDEYKICEPIPNHPLLDNVYYPEDIVKGYMWACRVEDLTAVVPEAPVLPPMELLQ